MLNFPSLAPNHHLACIHPSNEIHHGPQLVSRISFHNMDYWNDIFSVSVISKNVSFVYFLSPHWMFLAVFWLLATKLGSKFREFFGKNGVPREFQFSQLKRLPQNETSRPGDSEYCWICWVEPRSRLAVDLLQLICKRQLARYGCVVVVVAEKSWHQKESGKIKHLCLYALGTQALQKKHWKNPFWGLKPGC